MWQKCRVIYSSRYPPWLLKRTRLQHLQQSQMSRPTVTDTSSGLSQLTFNKKPDWFPHPTGHFPHKETFHFFISKTKNFILTWFLFFALHWQYIVVFYLFLCNYTWHITCIRHEYSVISIVYVVKVTSIENKFWYVLLESFCCKGEICPVRRQILYFCSDISLHM